MQWTRNIAQFLAVLILSATTLAGSGQSSPASTAPPAASGRDWWKNAVLYEIYPRSFQDSNGDGIGDLKGITQRLDYLQQLGVDAIWLTPIYPSPQVDFGYDISDYKAVDPQYGTMADFDRLVAEANKRHIRVIMDMVMNHTSDKHKWFLQSRSSRTNPYRDWYVWRDGKGETDTDKGAVPNNWESVFGHSAWEWDDKTRQYYYHKFYIQQPDLNWNNPKVHDAFKEVIKFWLKKGVAGFRFDAITTLFEDPNWTDEDELKDKDGKTYLNKFGDVTIANVRTDNLPGTHTVMAEMRATADTFSSEKFPGTRLFIGETYLPNIAELAKQYGTPGHPEFQLPMDTQLGFINKLDVVTFRSKLTDAETRIGGNTPLLVFDNHDNARLDARYGDGVHDTDIQRVISTVLFTSRGASLFYYGDEIGMKTTPPTRKEDVKDPVGLTGWPKEKGRDGERTPMQWDSTLHAGFTTPTAQPWLPVPASATTINVEKEKANPDSLLAWYQTLIRLKKTNASIARGDDIMLDTQNTKVLSWMRHAPGISPVIVAVNMTADPQTVNLTGGGKLPAGPLHTLLVTPGGPDPASLKSVSLGPFGVYIGQLQFTLAQ
jgi:alpha-glucosidase